MSKIRINKFLSEHGICSRRDADKLIAENKVTVNGVTAVMGQTVSDDDRVVCNGKIVASKKDKIVIAFNKPVGVVVSERDSHADKLIFDLIDYPDRLTYAGRLDKDSEGLMLLTNDGDFINQIMKASNNHEKEYQVRLDKEIADKDIKRLENGVFIKELNRTTKKCAIKRIGKYSVSMIITEGLNRQIRRMWKLAGYKVIKLKRVRIVNILLGDLKEGEWRIITGSELDMLYEKVGIGRK